jgi:HPt (histidine-containing phosphotransfer) domain-containing protein
MVQAAGEEDRDTVASLSHTLKSAARSVGAMRLGAWCENLEMTAHAVDATRIKTLTQDLQAQFGLVSDAIRRGLTQA